MRKPNNNTSKRKNEVSEKIIEQLIKDLKEGDFETQISAAEALGGIGDIRAVDPLIQVLRDKNKDIEVRIQVADALGKIGNFRAFEPLLKTIKKVAKKEAYDGTLLIEYNEEYEAFFNTLTWALGNISDPRAIDRLIKILKNEDDYVQSAASEALAKIGKPAVEHLIQALNDNNWTVRWEAIDALGKIKDIRAFESLLQALKDVKSEVRWKAAEALGKIGDKRAGDHLVKALEDEEQHVRYEATMALSEIGDIRAVDPLIKILEGKIRTKHFTDSFIRFKAKEALDKLGWKHSNDK